MSESAIEIKCSHNPLAWMLFFVKPVAVINGEKHEITWNKPHSFPVSPGTHEIEAYFNYIMGPACKGNISVEVQEGQTTSVTYEAPIFMFSAGTMKQV